MLYHWALATYALIFPFLPKPHTQTTANHHKPQAEKVQVPTFTLPFQTRPAIHLTFIISAESTTPTKKYKKTMTGKHQSGKDDLQDQTALNRRAERFQREHQMERQKWVGNGQSSFSHSSTNAHQDVFSSTSSTGNWDEPENDIVTFSKPSRLGYRYSFKILDHAPQDCRNVPGVIQGLPSPHIRGFSLLPF